MVNGGAAAAAAAMIQAIKASGIIVRIRPDDFRTLVGRTPDAWVVRSESRFFGTRYKYVLAHKGFAFYCKSKEAIPLPSSVTTINAKSIWAPE